MTIIYNRNYFFWHSIRPDIKLGMVVVDGHGFNTYTWIIKQQLYKKTSRQAAILLLQKFLDLSYFLKAASKVTFLEQKKI